MPSRHVITGDNTLVLYRQCSDGWYPGWAEKLAGALPIRPVPVGRCAALWAVWAVSAFPLLSSWLAKASDNPPGLDVSTVVSAEQPREHQFPPRIARPADLMGFKPLLYELDALPEREQGEENGALSAGHRRRIFRKKGEPAMDCAASFSGGVMRDSPGQGR